MINSAKFTSISEVFEYLQDGYSFSESLLDAINAHRQSKKCLEELFDSKLWVHESYVFDNDSDKQYYVSLGKIEEILVANDLIYND